MTRARRAGLAAGVALAVMSRLAFGAPEVNLHIETPSTLHTDGGSDLRLPPGYFLDEATRAALDTEMKRLQDQEVRLTAENTSLVKDAGRWQLGWYTLAVALAGGLALGWYAHSKL